MRYEFYCAARALATPSCVVDHLASLFCLYSLRVKVFCDVAQEVALDWNVGRDEEHQYDRDVYVSSAIAVGVVCTYT